MLKEHNNYQAWITDETGLVSCPGGDNKTGFTRRVINGYESLTENETLGNDLLLVCHGGVIVRVMEHLFPNTRDFYEWHPKPGRGYTITYTSSGLQSYKNI